MREAMATAEVGDEQAREDPTVLALERPPPASSGRRRRSTCRRATMANEIALVILGAPRQRAAGRGDRARDDLRARRPGAVRGPADARAARHARPPHARADPRARSVPPTRCTRRSRRSSRSRTRTTPRAASPGRCEELEAVVDVARELGLRVHLDGARLANAAVAIGRSAAEIGGLFDTVTLCLSKGLGCPLGAVLAGSHELMARARIEKHRFGGAMRQAGIVAAAGLYALEHNVDRLVDDHARARRLAEGWEAAGLPVDLERVQTNFVQIDVGALGLSAAEAIARLGRRGSCSPGRSTRACCGRSPISTSTTRHRPCDRARPAALAGTTAGRAVAGGIRRHRRAREDRCAPGCVRRRARPRRGPWAGRPVRGALELT